MYLNNKNGGEKMDYGLYLILGLFALAMIASSYMFNKLMKE
jgi:hypothetical protein